MIRRDGLSLRSAAPPSGIDRLFCQTRFFAHRPFCPKPHRRPGPAQTAARRKSDFVHIMFPSVRQAFFCAVSVRVPAWEFLCERGRAAPPPLFSLCPAFAEESSEERLSCLSSVLPWFLVPERSEGDGGAVPNNGPARRFARSISRLSVGGRISAGSTPAIPSPTPPAPAGRCSVIVASPSAAARPRRSVHPRPPAARYGGEAPGPGRRGYREGTRDRSLPPVQSFETGVSRRAFRDGRFETGVSRAFRDGRRDGRLETALRASSG